MFPEDGTLLKAVNYVGEMFIIEQIQLFQSPEAIKVLRFSDVTVIYGRVIFCLFCTTTA